MAGVWGMVATGAGAGQYSLRAVRVLAVDTTTEKESAAVAEDGVVRGEMRLVVTDEHSRRLLPAVAFLLENLGVGGTATERETLAGDVKGHALTLTLLGSTCLRRTAATCAGATSSRCTRRSPTPSIEGDGTRWRVRQNGPPGAPAEVTMITRKPEY